MSESQGEGGGSLIYNLLLKPRRTQDRAPQQPVGTSTPTPNWVKYMPFEDGISFDDFEEPQRFEPIPRPPTGRSRYERAPRQPVGISTPAPNWVKYMPFEDGISFDDFEEPQRFEPIPRPLTGSSSSVVNGLNWYYDKEVNPIRSANNALERSMPTTEESIGSGIVQVPKNIWSGLQVLTSQERRRQLDEDTRALLPFTSVFLSGGPKAIFEEGTGAVKDTFWDVLYDPMAHLRKVPYKTARVMSLAATPQEEYDRLDENVNERFDQLKFKMGTSFITGGLLSYAVKQKILGTGVRGAPVLAVLAGLSLFGIKSIGAFSEVLGEVSTVKRTMIDSSEGHHFDKRLQARAKPKGPSTPSDEI